MTQASCNCRAARIEVARKRALAAAVLAFVTMAASAAPVVIRDHDHLALSPAGDRVADVEADDPGNLADDPHGTVIVRDASGKVLATYDPCKACRYSDPTFSPKGVLAFIATDRKRGKATLYLADGKTPRVLMTITGIANDLRFSPDGARIAPPAC